MRDKRPGHWRLRAPSFAEQSAQLKEPQVWRGTQAAPVPKLTNPLFFRFTRLVHML
ncbi:MAG: hypothetical protein OEM24_05375 [Paracoccaceae bacterium]|nr:hypothetical protein [Paracoccaceae bacterium]